MPIMPFLGGLGAGLTGFTQANLQQDDARLRLQLLGEAIRQANQQRQAQSLMGAGLLGQTPLFGQAGGFPGGGPPAPPTAPLPQTAGLPGAAPAAAPSGPLAPSAPIVQQPLGVPGSESGTTDMPTDTMLSHPIYGAPPEQDAGGAAGAAGAATAGAGQPDTTTAGLTDQGAGAGRGFQLDPQMLQEMFHPNNAQQIAQAIIKERPDADPAAVAMATEGLMKMGNSGDRFQQALALKILQEAGMLQATDIRTGAQRDIAAANIAGRKDVAGMNIAGRADVAAANRASRENIAQQNRDAAMQRALIRMQTQGNPQVKQQAAILRAQVAQVSTRISQLVQAGAKPADIKAAYDEKERLQAKIADLYQRAFQQQSDQQPAAPSNLPPGGAFAPIPPG